LDDLHAHLREQLRVQCLVCGLLGPDEPLPNGCYQNDTSVQNAPQTPMFTDAIWINFDPIENDIPSRDLYNRTPGVEGMPRLIIARHGGRPAGSAPKSVFAGADLPGSINIVFADGHA
jgi:prepilin-type processing-associated H-X9-DG protein